MVKPLKKGRAQIGKVWLALGALCLVATLQLALHKANHLRSEALAEGQAVIRRSLKQTSRHAVGIWPDDDAVQHYLWNDCIAASICMAMQDECTSFEPYRPRGPVEPWASGSRWEQSTSLVRCRPQHDEQTPSCLQRNKHFTAHIKCHRIPYICSVGCTGPSERDSQTMSNLNWRPFVGGAYGTACRPVCVCAG